MSGRGRAWYELSPERRFYRSAQSQTTEAGISVGLLGNLYVSVGEDSGAGVVVRLWHHPLIVWIWVGGFAHGAGRGGVAQRPAPARRGARRGVAPTPAPPGARRMKRLLFLAPVLLFAGCWRRLRGPGARSVDAAVDADRQAGAGVRPAAGCAPGAAAWPDRGSEGEPVLLNVFASWCVPCRVEHPVLMRLPARACRSTASTGRTSRRRRAPPGSTEFGDPYRAHRQRPCRPRRHRLRRHRACPRPSSSMPRAGSATAMSARLARRTGKRRSAADGQAEGRSHEARAAAWPRRCWRWPGRRSR